MTNPHTERHAVRIRAQESGWSVFIVTPTSDRFRHCSTEIVVAYDEDQVKRAKMFDLSTARSEDDAPRVDSFPDVMDWLSSVRVH